MSPSRSDQPDSPDRPAGLSEAERKAMERQPPFTNVSLQRPTWRAAWKAAREFYLAAGPSEDEVERMTRVVYRGTGPGSIFPWENVDEPSKKAWRAIIRESLAARGGSDG